MSVMKQETCLVTVDYDLPIDAVIEAGRYWFVSKRVLGTRLLSSRTGIEELEGLVVNFDQSPGPTTPRVLKTLSKAGLRPADLRELTAFGMNYQDTLGKRRVVALGRNEITRDGDGNPCCATILERRHPDARPHLKVACDDPTKKWTSLDWFLAFREQEAGSWHE